MHQTTCQIARETGIHHPSVYSIIHQDFQLISLKKQRAQELTTATVYISQDLSLLLQGRVGAHKSGVVGNTIYVLLQISSGMLLPKIIKTGSRLKKVIAKNKKGIIFKHSVQKSCKNKPKSEVKRRRRLLISGSPVHRLYS